MSQSGQWKHNVKQVIRVTLVGIDPSDQVQIKGYLRIILRVDFDIEWVSPKNPKVDLFIVNQAFSNSDSVKSLINQSNSPVLYIANSKEKSNTIEGNTLYLKLEQVTVLETWLKNYVPKIQATNNNDHLVKSSMTDNTNGQLEKTFNTPVPASSQPSTPVINTAIKTNELSRNAIDLINVFNDTLSEDYYNLSHNGKTIAIIQPKKRSVWLESQIEFPAFSLDWKLTAINPAPMLQIRHSQNLSTWLWTCCMQPNSSIAKILPSESKLYLKTWPKPQNTSNKSNYLRIIAMTELKPLSVNDIVLKTNLDRATVHQCMAALYMSGFMESGLLTLDVYVKQQVRLQEQKTQALNQETTPNNTQTPVMKEQPATPKHQQNSYVDDLSKSAVTKDKGFSGILSRIRVSLGF